MKLSYNWLKQYVDLDVSAAELADGLTMSGSEVEASEEVGGDTVMELEITSNRPDCLNITGLAREAAAVFDKELRLPETKVEEEGAADGPKIECVIKDKKLCSLYTARVIEDVNISHSNDDIKSKLSGIGLRTVNNIVDITNFCLMELGQPLHAFDLDKIQGNKIIVRGAKKGEKIVTIDDVERELEPGMTVIADGSGPIAIAGVMGGKKTEVTDCTKNVLLESAYFDPISIRQTGRKLTLSSDSSYRFERGVDKGAIKNASDRAAALIAAETGGKVRGFFSSGCIDTEEVSIELDMNRASKILGIVLEKNNAMRILRKLGMTISEDGADKLIVKVPSFREDLRNDVDLVEEIARIYGYDNIPAKISKLIPQVKRKEPSRRAEEQLRNILPSLGLNEIMTYSLISEKSAERFPAITEGHVYLKNPLSEEQKVLTPQLLDGMLKSIAWNINRKNRDLGLFEIGKIYSSAGKKDFKEIRALCVGLTGAMRKNWRDGQQPANFYDLKGIIEEALRSIKVHVSFSQSQVEGFSGCADIKLDEESIGFIGEVRKNILKEYDIEQQVFVCQIKMDTLFRKADLDNRYHSIPRFPSSKRDISILCDEVLTAAEIKGVISGAGGEILRRVELVDVYEGKQIEGSKKSLTYSIEYGLNTRTLTDEEIENVHSAIKQALETKLKISFR